MAGVLDNNERQEVKDKEVKDKHEWNYISFWQYLRDKERMKKEGMKNEIVEMVYPLSP